MYSESNSRATDIGLLAMRLVSGGLMAGHGAQKLFGSFGGHGLSGTAGWLESMRLKPGKLWAAAAGTSEFGSGLLTTLGLGGPAGPIAMTGPMIMAWITTHAGKPIWVSSGGAELPLVYLSNAAALALAGPGRYSLDEALGLRGRRWLGALTAAGVAAGIGAAVWTRKHQAELDEQPALSQDDTPAPEEHEHAPGPAMSELPPEEPPLRERAVGDSFTEAEDPPELA